MRDLCLAGNESQRMNWADVAALMKMGHEVYPHTIGHVDLLALERKGDIAELEHQIDGAIAMLKEKTGVPPKFFCSPHNSSTTLIIESIRKYGAEIFATDRPNFGWGNLPGMKNSIAKFLRWQYEMGNPHVDIMVHGIVKAHGGWRPFESCEQFVEFLDEIDTCVKAGWVKVVPYASAHHRYGRLVSYLHRKLARARRILFKLRYRNRLTYEFPPLEQPFWL